MLKQPPDDIAHLPGFSVALLREAISRAGLTVRAQLQAHICEAVDREFATARNRRPVPTGSLQTRLTARPESEPHVVSEGGTPEDAEYWAKRNADTELVCVTPRRAIRIREED